MPDNPTFDAAIIETEVAALRRASFARAAQLIEDLWAEVRRVTHPEYVSKVPMTKADREGPFLAKPQVDVEFTDENGDVCGVSTVGLEMRINERGLLIISETRAAFTAQQPLSVTGYRIWVGGDLLEAHIPPQPLKAGDTYALALDLPIRLGRDIDHWRDGRRGPDRPMPPLPKTDKAPGSS